MRSLDRFRNLPVRHKLRMIGLITVCTALLAACGAALAYDRIATR